MNQCGDCTLCCELMEIKELNKPAYQMCELCDNGCIVHPNHPRECQSFDCAWLQTKSHVELRPDKCGVIFEKLGDHIFHGTIKPNTELSDTVRGQIHSFINQGLTVFIKDGDTYMKFLGIGHTELEMEEEFQEPSEDVTWRLLVIQLI